MRRRILFAAPIVAIACRRPVEDPAPPPPAPVATPDARRVREPPPVDAIERTVEEMAAYCARRDVMCNPPPPRRAPDAALPRFEGRVIAARAAAHGSVVTIALGARDGVVASWRGELYRGARRIGSFTIESIAEGSTTGATDVPREQLDAAVVARFTP